MKSLSLSPNGCHLEAHLSPSELQEWHCLENPATIQSYLDRLEYATDHDNRCPLRAIRERRGNCFDGALLAAAALRRLGFPPRLVNLYPEPGTDDEHVIAVFQRNGRYGALGKSNFVGLRFREAVYITLRELVMSYFELYYNVAGYKTLREYSLPVDLRPLDRLGWESSDKALTAIIERLDHRRRVALLNPEMIATLSPVDERSLQAGLLGAQEAGLFRPHHISSAQGE